MSQQQLSSIQGVLYGDSSTPLTIAIDGGGFAGVAAGLALAAGQRSMQIGAAEYPHPPGAAFEVIGVDFLVDSALRPWLLEFNAIPSMARQVTAASNSIPVGLPPPWPAPALLCSGVCARSSSVSQGFIPLLSILCTSIDSSSKANATLCQGNIHKDVTVVPETPVWHVQVLQGGSGNESKALNAFDEQKEAVVSSLFELLLVNTGANRQERSTGAGSETAPRDLADSRQEVEAGRQLDFLPLCAADEALRLSAKHQPQALRKPDDGRKQGLFAAIAYMMSRALMYLPARIARGLLTLLTHDLQMNLMAKMPGLDNILLSMKLLAEGHLWRPGRNCAMRLLYVSPIDKVFCQWLHSTAT